jgi:hypothetical protein
MTPWYKSPFVWFLIGVMTGAAYMFVRINWKALFG